MIFSWIHVHSRHSFDGVLTTEAIVEAAVRQGIELLAVTDHDNPRGADEARELVARRGLALQVPAGWEASTDAGHILVLGCETFLPLRSARALCDAVHTQGGLCVYAHPFQGEYRPDPEVALAVDGFEAPNLRTGLADNLRALSLARELGQPVVGGVDAHSLPELERAVVCLEQPDLLSGGQTLVNCKPKAGLRAREALRKSARTKNPSYMLHLMRAGMRRLVPR